ncbi:Ubiquitin carboxyl-terminal hydrolase 64E [Anabarilius grahami]|uniref:Ubiquitin carboxyl-terminal hydrolase 64E n=1 Tax=Anabarilius grahami TaxID=495550 RepID=A0A3N0YE68_ANAGA|nr:Ubiquitin carboxyl-terminal hydrolase 64E [Anabarilius grahami]
MAFQLFIRFNDERDTVLDVADSSKEFDETKVREVKKKFRPVDDDEKLDLIRVIFGTEQLEDEKTLGFYKITHGSVLIFVMRKPGGKKGETTGEGAEGYCGLENQGSCCLNAVLQTLFMTEEFREHVKSVSSDNFIEELKKLFKELETQERNAVSTTGIMKSLGITDDLKLNQTHSCAMNNKVLDVAVQLKSEMITFPKLLSIQLRRSGDREVLIHPQIESGSNGSILQSRSEWIFLTRQDRYLLRHFKLINKISISPFAKTPQTAPHSPNPPSGDILSMQRSSNFPFGMCPDCNPEIS